MNILLNGRRDLRVHQTSDETGFIVTVKHLMKDHSKRRWFWNQGYRLSVGALSSTVKPGRTHSIVSLAPEELGVLQGWVDDNIRLQESEEGCIRIIIKDIRL